MRLPSKRTVKSAAACALGAAVLLFPGSVLMLAAGAALGFWGCIRLEQRDHESQ